MSETSCKPIKQIAAKTRALKPPSYDRNRQRFICHIGPGNFHRAHQAVYLHRLLQSGVEQEWGICAIGLMPSDRALQQALERQNYIYTVWECDNGQPRGEMLGAICDFVDASSDSRPAIARLAASNTHIVSLTITEKGYHLLPDGNLNLQSPDIAHDIQYPDHPRSAVGLIVAALYQRFQQGQAPFTVMSCDNLRENGHQTRRAVCTLAKHRSSGFADWIAQTVCFPLSMVDRITPTPDPAISQRIRMDHHLADEVLLLCEPWMQWVIEDRFNSGRPAWDRAGAQFSDEVHRFEEMKVSLLNGSHSAMSHLGLLLGFDHVHEFCRSPQAEIWLQEYMAEVLPALNLPADVSAKEYCTAVIRRFQNGGIIDRLQRLANDSSSKFRQCVFPVLARRVLLDQDSPRICQAISLWFYYLAQLSDKGHAAGSPHYQDPLLPSLIAAAGQLYQNGGVSYCQLKVMLKSLLDWSDTQIGAAAMQVQAELHAIYMARSISAWWQQQYGPAP